MHLLIPAPETEAHLQNEIDRLWPGSKVRAPAPGLLAWDAAPTLDRPYPPLVFCRQLLPGAARQEAASISAWANCLVNALAPACPEEQPWRLLIAPHYGVGEVGQRRCGLIREAVRERLQRHHRRLLRQLDETTSSWTPETSLVQLLLTAPDAGFVSVAPAPLPWIQRHLILPFPKGNIPLATDRQAPSRAFAKLAEVEHRFGRRIERGDQCVDLGASPGSWTYWALGKEAKVVAVDRAPLRDDLMRHPRVQFHRGDAFAYQPKEPADWLLCDVIAAPERSIGLILHWTQRRWARRFVVTIKFKGHADYPSLDRLKHELPARCDEYGLSHLCANRNEACAYGVVRTG
jgi:23S rRNA (cytidine2498-2'-O)-methyltransferase